MKTKYIKLVKNYTVNADIFKHDYIFLPADTKEEADEIEKLNGTVLADMIDARHQKRIEDSRKEAMQRKLEEQCIREMLWLPTKEC